MFELLDLFSRTLVIVKSFYLPSFSSSQDDDDFPMCELLEQYCDSLYQILCVPTDVPIYKKGDKALVPKLRHTVASAFLK